mgnify:CR=1 FL=1
MGFLDTVTGWFKREAKDVKDSVDQLEDRLDADLRRREHEMTASPEERMEMIQAETGVDDAFAAIQDRIDGSQAHADATADLMPTDGPASDDPAPDDPSIIADETDPPA